ncbi:MAG: cyclopropane fatty acyl phospholipid synthase, partial [Candidatus Doudnabacteria bacterium]|nr:cyclopropane fatty acyl phospholipid synthase [Candidatus Doudnabacteria bacterium]
LSSGIDKKVMNWRTALYAAKAVVVNLGSRGRAFDIGEHHYDTGNELYKRMLDPRMTYTCGYWNGGAQTLEEAQEAKLDLICKKLRLEPGMRLLDIGGGWGSLTIFAAERYGVEAVNVTVSKEQLALGQQKAEERGVADKVEMRYQDYRAVDDGPYDRIASVGMFEHVGYKNYRDFMEVAYRLLKEEGLFLLHTIGGNKSVKTTDRWIGTYIFPNSMLPSVAQIGAAMEHLFVMEDWHNFGPNYDTTLMEWYKNFHAAWPELEKTGKYDERFMRMWDFYLMSSAASFRVRNIQLWQVLLSKGRIPGGLTRIS